jgi:DNA-binding transcriptional LysR family regulator
MIISDEYVDLIENNVDLAIRIAVMKDSSLIARKLAPNPRTLFASPSYIEKYGKPNHPDEILDHHLITFRQGSPYNDWHFLVDGKIKLIHAKGKLQLNHGDAILRSAINGGGLAMLSRFVVGRHLVAGSLVSILDEYVQEDVPIYAVYPSGKHLSPKVRAFLDFLIEVYGPVPYWDEKGDHNSEAAKRTVI